ncbi:Formylglycine-generating enzyme, required for sulfatase activity, contains SUMF1/FGE domain [Andreprevotia lacus DSM 23236]|jgi:formylglycine-generating enzyme required for sulfatase activity|uniref:Formylglycine-generating enzyme, required for sulfatase activity, contains SUMF1/FGE domain n=1 Tax=Andreprevotia lacus DSM 23236 TaxID=1121001 RepID=A0A1W1Y0J6_9NEIS|nr:SUMF1/EgtB/PvdO family nonheme iron enzyme [Andreprevotia lacus]SMC29654.1 Formylglycine-generating enzyme, required for sulfatase activity, contains SUMF1/FGE domain [Andreprevotia lacus DSM 23236]
MKQFATHKASSKDKQAPRGWQRAAWTTIAALLLGASQATSAAAWLAGSTYEQGDIVTHQGQEWQARWWTRGDVPGTQATAWQVAPSEDAPAWQAATVYQGGELVLHAGLLYQAQWWSRGETPGTAGSAWRALGSGVKAAQFVRVPGGRFIMGATIKGKANYDNEEPVHPVTLSSFWLSSTEVTYRQFDRYTRATSQPLLSNLDAGGLAFGCGERPAVNVSWWAAVRYINWLNQQHGWPRSYDENSGNLLDAAGLPTTDVAKVIGYRLPTEAEWEYAARERGRDIINAWGNGEPVINGKPAANVADASLKAFFEPIAPLPWWLVPWQADDGYARLAPVGSFIPNALGLYDMSGNAWEWTTDQERVYTTQAQVNPVGVSTSPGRIMRGASWDNGQDMHITDRYADDPATSTAATGLRLARSGNAEANWPSR